MSKSRALPTAIDKKKIRRLATGKLLRQLIKSGMEGNLEAFRAASEEVIKEERQKQHHLLANDLIW